MPDPEVQRVAELLATHALALLGVAVAGVAVSLAAAVWLIRIITRHRPAILRAFDALVERAGGFGGMRAALARGKVLVPSAYLGLHLALGLVVAVAVAVFAALAQEVVTNGDMAAFDVVFARALREERSEEWYRFFSTVSMFGSSEVLTIVATVVGMVLLFKRTTVLAIGWLAAQSGGGLLNAALKEAFERTRPEFADPVLAESWSFPSGHAMGTLILCGMGCYLVVRELQSWTAAGLAIAVTVAWCLVMAFSRLYLGVHFVSDVIAGFAAGLAWTTACISALEIVRRDGAT